MQRVGAALPGIPNQDEITPVIGVAGAAIDPLNQDETAMQMKIFHVAACTFSLAASASAADLAQMPIKAISPPAAVFSWTGFYLGAAVGMRSNQSEMDIGQGVQTVNGGAPTTFTTGGLPGINLNSTALKGDAFLGFNYQIAQWVAGIEGSFGYADPKIAGQLSVLQLTPTGSANLKTTWDSAVRGRLGYLITPSVLVFGAAGPAWQHIEVSLTCGATQGCGVPIGGTTFSPVAATRSFDKLGWTAGGGLEVALASNWLARAEYKYADFGSVSLPVTATGTNVPAAITISRTGTHDTTLQTHSATFGFAYKFGI